MSEEQNNGLGTPRRSTRPPKPGAAKEPKDASANGSPESPSREPVGDKSSASSRLANGSRTEPKSSSKGSSGQNKSKAGNGTQRPSALDEASAGTGPRKGHALDAVAGSDKSRKDSDAQPDQKTGKNNITPGPSSKAGKDMKSALDTDATNDKVKPDMRGSNATGVDYSDKSMKDQLEHQAADLAMDATPILGQINSARKALKEANKKKRELTGPKEDDALDSVEKGADKVVDGGIKGVKIAAAGAAAGSVGSMAMATMMVIKLLMMIKGAAMAMLGKVLGFFTGIIKGAGSIVSGLLGVSATVGNAIASGIIGITLTVGGGLGIGALENMNRDPGGGACLPDSTSVPESSQDYVQGGGDASLIQEENAGKLWSVYSELGASKEQTAAVLGNLHHESSGLDPTATETIYAEPFQMGPRKMDALAKDYQVGLIDSAYGARFPAIEYIGIGLAQWTNDRNRLLIDYADKQGSNWYEFDTQVGFMLAGDSPVRQTQLTDFLSATPGNIDAETERFMNTWIGLSSPNPSIGERKTNSAEYLFLLERATADTDYAETILSGINVNRGDGNASAGAYHRDDGCGDAIISHYRGKEVDGTGEVPAGLVLVPWTRETLPESLKAFSVDPALAGLAWGSDIGWASGVIADQCVALSTSYFMQLYPGWDKDGKATTRPFGNGKDTAPGWAAHYGEALSDSPQAGAVFSDKTSSSYGHTGIVQHVFANGDILVNEQNVRGASGEGAGISYSWSWRIIKKDRYQQSNWVFFKPANAEPQWSGGLEA